MKLVRCGLPQLAVVLVCLFGLAWSAWGGVQAASYNGGGKAISRDEMVQIGAALALSGGKRLEKFLYDAVASGNLSEDDLFDENYQEVAGDGGKRFTNRFDAYFDRNVQDLLDSYRKGDRVLFAVAMDRKGFVPTSPAIAEQNDRIFDDRTTQAILRDRKKVHVEIYPKKDGDQVQGVFDFSAPVSVYGRFWGYFRIALILERGR